MASVSPRERAGPQPDARDVVGVAEALERQEYLLPGVYRDPGSPVDDPDLSPLTESTGGQVRGLPKAVSSGGRSLRGGARLFPRAPGRPVRGRTQLSHVVHCGTFANQACDVPDPGGPARDV